MPRSRKPEDLCWVSVTRDGLPKACGNVATTSNGLVAMCADCHRRLYGDREPDRAEADEYCRMMRGGRPLPSR